MKYALACLFAATCLYAADWPIFRGANQDAAVADAKWDTTLGGGDPKVLWELAVGPGYTSMTVVGDRLYTMGSKGATHIVYCLHAVTGKEMWTASYAAVEQIGGYFGPRSTPTVAGGKVYTVSNNGQVHCFDAADGKVVWVRDDRAIANLLKTQWGAAASVLVVDGVAVLNAGSYGMGLDAATGKTVWSSPGGAAGYATPVRCMNGAGAAIFTAEGLAVVRVKDGKHGDIHRWETKYNVNAADPVIHGGRFLISSNYNKGSALLDYENGKFKTVWENTKLRSWFPSPVLVGGRLVGNDQGNFVCLDWATGKEIWRGPKAGIGGTVTLLGDQLLLLTERGELQVLPAKASTFAPTAEARVLSGQCWTSPVYVDGLVYVRSSKPGQLRCLDLRLAK